MFSQETLVGLFLIGLVGDVGQVDPAQGRAVSKNNVAHIEAEDVLLQTLLQVQQKPEKGG